MVLGSVRRIGASFYRGAGTKSDEPTHLTVERDLREVDVLGWKD